MEKIRLSIIGCGAVTERCHLPAAVGLENCEVMMLVDRDGGKAKRIAEKVNVPFVSTDYRDVINKVDAAILALPHNLHASVSIELLNAGIHVLVEKPMAMTASECKEMLKSAEIGRAVLAVGLMRRFLNSALFTKHTIESGLLGRIKSFDFREGNVYNWPVSSDFVFKREMAGGGVLFDAGAHTLDLLLWWLGDMEVVRYFDDSFGGVEADCEIWLKSGSKAEGIVELSRTRDLRNTAIIKGELGQIEVDLRKNKVSLTTRDGETSIVGYGQLQGQPDVPKQGFFELFPLQLSDFVHSIQSGRSPRACGEEAARSVALIEACYQKRELLSLSWMSLNRAHNMELENKRVLVTGATGFIGGRLIERLFIEKGAKIKVLVRNFKNASRIARFPVEMVGGDILDEEKVAKAVEGCDEIFHCAYDFSGGAEHKEEVSVKGTENICKAALKHGVKRVVHMSTISVYGSTPDGDFDETSPRQPSEDVYAQTKLAGEELVLAFNKSHGLPVTVIQPTIVYGPFSKPWAINPIKQMLSGLVVIPNGGEGFCNAVYIDDVVDAMFLAAVRDEAVGEVFLISGLEPVSWKEFYGSLENLLGWTATIFMIDNEIEELQQKKFGSIPLRPKQGTMRELLSVLRGQTLWEQIYNIPGIRDKAGRFKYKYPKVYDYAIRKIFGVNRSQESNNKTEVLVQDTQNIHVPDKTRYELLRSKTRVRIDKAQRLLGYEPRYDFKKGMSLTAEFLRWGNYCA